MKGHLLIILALLIIAMTGCRKIGKSGVSGTVREKGTGLPFPNVGVYVERTTKSGMNSKTYPTIIGNTVTDANGHYDLSFSMKFNYLYRIYCTPIEDGKGKTYTAIASNELPTKNENVDFVLPPFAYVKIYQHKTSNIVTDWAYLQFDYAQSVDLNVPNYPFDAFLGVYRVKGNESITVSWMQYYNNKSLWTGRSDKEYINKGDTLSYDIHFN